MRKISTASSLLSGSVEYGCHSSMVSRTSSGVIHGGNPSGAPAGPASPWIQGPSTLHSAARLPLSYEEDSPRRCEKGRRKLEDARVIIIDEISMIDSRTFDFFVKRTHSAQGILAVGDFFQLPLVSEDHEGQPNYAFRSAAFSDFKVVELTQVHRQDEPEFIRFLGRLRHGEADLDFYAELPGEFDLGHPVLFGTRREAKAQNQREIEKIQQPSAFARFQVEVGDHEAAVRWFDSYTRAVQVLELKPGMRVLCIRNHDALVNGDLGTVTDIADQESECGPAWIDVELDRLGPVRSFPFRFELKRTVRGQEVTVYAVRQFAFVPAYGLTVHKAQGMTLDVINVDGSRVNFAAGQVYVALSRCKTKAGLRVANASQFAAFTRLSVERYYEIADRL